MHRKLYSLLLIALLFNLSVYAQNNVGIGTINPEQSAILHLESSDKGLLVPRLTAVQRAAISSPATGLFVYDIDAACFFYYKDAINGWINLCSAVNVAVGITGHTGSTGATGVQGIVGVTGATGNDGNNGNNGEVGVTGATGNDGNNGAIGVTGATGNNGSNGAIGATGATGTNGSNGVIGMTGATGNNGSNGAIGVTGATGNNGNNGVIGVTGATGNNGSNGVIGITGATGNNGNNGVIGVTGATGNNGSNGVIGIKGATGNNGSNGVIGITGATGNNGNNGTVGVTGTTGNNGSNGAVGVTGATGNNGSNGVIGITGATGNNGNNGVIGITGATGNNGNNGVIGITGATGNNGNNGAIGVTGATGNNGNNGEIGATGATGNNGSNGEIGMTGATGNNGNNGEIGVTGATGNNGNNGEIGVTGITGNNGAVGVTGVTGATGNNGTNGTNGAQGITGATGPVGCTGTNFILKSTGSSADCSVIFEDGSGLVGIGTISPSQKLDVNGIINASTGYRVGNTAALTGTYLRGNGTNFVPSSIQLSDIPDLGSGYIKNQTSQQSSANFNIDGNGTTGGYFGIGTTASTVAKLQVHGGALGTNANDILELARFYATTNNGSALRIFYKRHVAGSDWTSTGTRIQQRVDITDQGYIEFNPANGNYGIGFGNGSNEFMRINDNGTITVNNLSGTGNRTVYANATGTLVIGTSLNKPTSCKEIKQANPLSPNGVYEIDPDGPGALPVVPCYCDMTTNGGGWTKLNSALTGITVSKGSAAWITDFTTQSDAYIQGNGAGTGCGVNRIQYTLSTPTVSFTEVYVLLTRTSSVLQCSGITSGTTYGWYNPPYKGTYTSNTTCNWSDGAWANATDNNMSGLKLNWIMFSNASNTSLQYTTECSNTTDNGTFYMQWFVR